MSAFSLSAVPRTAVRPLPWHRLGWVVWRRYRGTLVGAAGVLAAVAAYLVVTGLQTRSAWNTVQACTPARSQACMFAWDNFSQTHANPGLVSALFLFAPLLIGAFTGGPLLGRELETGTFRYAWTQGVGRSRWALATVVGGAVLVAALAGGLGALVAWHDQPLYAADIVPRLAAGEFPSAGVAAVGWALLAYAVGLLAGLLLRRALPAVATAVAATFGLAFAASRLRPHYLAPLRTSSLEHVAGSQVVAQWWAQGDRHVSIADLDAVLRAAGMQEINTGGSVAASPGAGDDPVTYLVQHGYTQWTTYQPGAHYWPMQWIELGWLVAVAVGLVTVTLIVLRRRDA